MIKNNKENYEELYSKGKNCLIYPADWVIRFHNMFMKKNLPKGRVLDFGCGSGNNSIFFIEKGYDVHGTEVTDSALDLIKSNLEFRHLNKDLICNFSILPPNITSLPYEDGFFDFIISNQVLYYLPSKEHIQKLCKEFSRCLAKNGLVFFTMMGVKNDYIAKHTKEIKNNIHEISIDNPKHRLNGVKEFIYPVKDEKELINLFSEFECISAGHFEQSMLDLNSNHHFIFIGRKK